MCWTGKPIKKIAQNNIPIYKVCTNSFYEDEVVSIFKGFIYKLNKTYKSNIEATPINDLGNVLISKAFHSYGANTFIKKSIKTGSITIFGHSKKINSQLCCKNLVKVLGYVPKGSEYYENIHGEIVSDQICLTKIKAL